MVPQGQKGSSRMSRFSSARYRAPIAPIIFSGWQDMERLRILLSTAYRTAGVSVVLDPTSDPSLRDYLMVGASTALQHAAVGTVIGGLFGALVGDVGAGMALGAVVGVGTGIARGVATVDDGWRVHVSWGPSGAPIANVWPLENRQ